MLFFILISIYIAIVLFIVTFFLLKLGFKVFVREWSGTDWYYVFCPLIHLYTAYYLIKQRN